MIVRCPICGRYVRGAKELPDGTWHGECAEDGPVTGDKE